MRSATRSLRRARMRAVSVRAACRAARPTRARPVPDGIWPVQQSPSRRSCSQRAPCRVGTTRRLTSPPGSSAGAVVAPLELPIGQRSAMDDFARRDGRSVAALVVIHCARGSRPRPLRRPHVRLLRDADRLGDGAARRSPRGTAGARERRRRRTARGVRPARGRCRAAAVSELPRGARSGAAGRRRGPRRRRGSRRGRALLGDGSRLARVRRLGRRAAPAARAVPARRDHELRHRPLRRVERAPRSHVRLGGDCRDGPELQARARRLRARLRGDRRAAASGSSTWRRASSTTTSPRRLSACTRCGSTGGTIGRAPVRRPPAEAVPDATYPSMGAFADAVSATPPP